MKVRQCHAIAAVVVQHRDLTAGIVDYQVIGRRQQGHPYAFRSLDQRVRDQRETHAGLGGTRSRHGDAAGGGGVIHAGRGGAAQGIANGDRARAAADAADRQAGRSPALHPRTVHRFTDHNHRAVVVILDRDCAGVVGADAVSLVKGRQGQFHRLVQLAVLVVIRPHRHRGAGRTRRDDELTGKPLIVGAVQGAARDAVINRERRRRAARAGEQNHPGVARPLRRGWLRHRNRNGRGVIIPDRHRGRARRFIGEVSGRAAQGRYHGFGRLDHRIVRRLDQHLDGTFPGGDRDLGRQGLKIRAVARSARPDHRQVQGGVGRAGARKAHAPRSAHFALARIRRGRADAG